MGFESFVEYLSDVLNPVAEFFEKYYLWIIFMPVLALLYFFLKWLRVF